MTMAQLADMLPSLASGYVFTPVLDATGLKDAYDFTLSFSTAGQLRSVPPPPPSSFTKVKAFMALVNPLLQQKICSVLDVDHIPEAICFKSMLKREAHPYADGSLQNLIETNIAAGNVLLVLMVSLHLGGIDLEAADRDLGLSRRGRLYRDRCA